MFMYDHRLACQGVFPSRLVQLQEPSFKLDRVVIVDVALVLHAEHPVQVFAAESHERAALLRRRYAEPSVEISDVLLAKELVRLLDISDAADPEFLRQTSLPRPEVSLRSATGLRRIRRDHADPQILQCASHLRGTARINTLATFCRHKEMSCAVAVQRAERTSRFNHLPQCCHNAPR